MKHRYFYFTVTKNSLLMRTSIFFFLPRVDLKKLNKQHNELIRPFNAAYIQLIDIVIMLKYFLSIFKPRYYFFFLIHV